MAYKLYRGLLYRPDRTYDAIGLSPRTSMSMLQTLVGWEFDCTELVKREDLAGFKFTPSGYLVIYDRRASNPQITDRDMVNPNDKGCYLTGKMIRGPILIMPKVFVEGR